MCLEKERRTIPSSAVLHLEMCQELWSPPKGGRGGGEGVTTVGATLEVERARWKEPTTPVVSTAARRILMLLLVSGFG